MHADRPTANQTRVYIIWPVKIFSRPPEVRACWSCQLLVYASFSKSPWPCSKILLKPLQTAPWEPLFFTAQLFVNIWKQQTGLLMRRVVDIHVEKKVLVSSSDGSRCGQSSPIILKDSYHGLDTMLLCPIYRCSNFLLVLTHVFPYGLSWCFCENHPLWH